MGFNAFQLVFKALYFRDLYDMQIMIVITMQNHSYDLVLFMKAPILLFVKNDTKLCVCFLQRIIGTWYHDVIMQQYIVYKTRSVQ